MFACIHVPDTRAAAAAHAALLDFASAFSPRVEDSSTGTVVLDVEGLERLFGSTEELGRRLLDYASTLGTAIHVGIASNPDAAICAARGWPGTTILERKTEAARLKDLDVALLPLEPETHETLLRWGVRTFGALAKLPAKELAVRLGQQGVHLHRLARGNASRPLRPRKETLHFEEAMELDDAITTLEPLAFILNRLCDILFLRLRSRGLAALELRLKLKRERPHEPFIVPLRLPVPARNPRVITRLFMLSLDARPPGAGVCEVRLEAIPSKPRVIQNGLFVPLAPEPEQLELTLARISGIVGKHNVGSPALANAYARDRFEMKHFGENFGSIERRPHGALRIFRPPLEATVRLLENVPAWIGFSGMHGDIAAASGPWRNSGEWWNNRQWSREEWDVAVSTSLLRIYRDSRDNRWYAEGIYD
ncbi:MAG TPA: DNA polymerase Y family protein [Terriglobia bacterium]|nr:DNA polymerase Y family protein [Terriglobia bacterium]